MRARGFAIGVTMLTVALTAAYFTATAMDGVGPVTQNLDNAPALAPAPVVLPSGLPPGINPTHVGPTHIIPSHINPTLIGPVNPPTSAPVSPSTSASPSTSPTPTPLPTPSPTKTPTTPSSTPTRTVVPPARTTIVQLGEVNSKQVLVDQNRHTLYAFTHDRPGVSTCDAACSTTWPPLVGPATAGNGVDRTELKTLTRSDGSLQVTYFGNPLYYFAGDQRPGEARGVGIAGTWFLVDSQGHWVR
jgi:predicted lipoprotein with Yx(FWY)xxD motif